MADTVVQVFDKEVLERITEKQQEELLASECGQEENGGTDKSSNTINNPDEAEGDEDQAIPRLPEAAWRGPFASYRDAVVATTEASDSFHWVALASLAGSLLGRRVYLHQGLRIYPNVFTLLVGPSGDRKSSALRLVLDQIPEDPPLKTIRGVGSGEALGDQLTVPDGAPPIAHLIVLDEIASLLRRGGWQGATLIPSLTELFDCPPTFEIPFRSNPIFLTKPTLSLLAATTPAWWWQTHRDVDVAAGFASRIFYAAATRDKPALPFTSPPDGPAITDVRRALASCCSQEWGEAKMTGEAKMLFADFYRKCREELGSDEKIAHLAQRTPVYAVKFAMIVAGLEGTLPEIGRDQLAAGVAVAAFGIESAKWLFAQREPASHRGRVERLVRNVLSKATRPLSPSSIQKCIGGHRADLHSINCVLLAMERAGAVSESPGWGASKRFWLASKRLPND